MGSFFQRVFENALQTVAPFLDAFSKTLYKQVRRRTSPHKSDKIQPDQVIFWSNHVEHIHFDHVSNNKHNMFLSNHLINLNFDMHFVFQFFMPAYHLPTTFPPIIN
jgi:hypothetical protein